MHCDYSFVAVVKSVSNFSASFEKALGVFFLAVWMVKIVEDVDSFDSPADISLQTYRCFIQIKKFFSIITIFSVLLKILMGERGAIECITSHTSTMEPFSFRGSNKEHPLSMPQGNKSRTRCISIFHALCFLKIREGHLRKLRHFYQKCNTTSSAFFSAFLCTVSSTNEIWAQP